MLMRVMVKSPLRRRASRSTQARLSAPKGGGIGRMFVSHAAVLASIFKILRQFASQRVGFVSTLPITLRLGLTHTRLIGLRAANSACRRLSCLSRLSLFFLSSLFGSPVPCQSLGLPGASGDVCVWVLSVGSLVSFLSLSLSCRSLCSAGLLSSLLPLGR